MRVTTLCLVCSISLPPSIRWTTMSWRSACRGPTGSVRPRLIGFGSYLCDRRQTILFDGVFSTVRSLSCGVPQGSVLGPLLFLLYTADLGELAASLSLSSHFYADDSQLYTCGPPSTVAQQRRRMELGIERIAEWMRSNRLRLNP